jgi:hypothetical protein
MGVRSFRSLAAAFLSDTARRRVRARAVGTSRGSGAGFAAGAGGAAGTGAARRGQEALSGRLA